MRKVILLFLCLVSSHILKSQTWQEYSDSIYKIMQTGDWQYAQDLIDKTDELLQIQGFKIDTNYADFLYRKGVLLSSAEKNKNISLDYILSAERIWVKSKTKNNQKLMFIYFWLANLQYDSNKYNEALQSYKLSIDYNTKLDTINQYILLNSNYYLGEIYYLLAQEDCNSTKIL